MNCEACADYYGGRCICGIVVASHESGHRSGLLRAARRASAMAGRMLHIACPRPNADCAHCALLRLAASLREEAGE